jgi:hypothetical protein
MEQIKAVEFTSTKAISKVDTDRSNVPTGKYIEKTLENTYDEKRTTENNASTAIKNNCHYSFGSGVGSLLSRESRNSSICDGFGCSLRATTELQVNAGQKRSITLYLCGSCVNKFRDQSQRTKLGE